MTDRPDMPQDVFIDDIPYPETQNYVKKILATAEDYKRLYGPDAMRGQEPDLDAKLPSATFAPAAKPVAPRPAAPKATAKPAAAPARQSPKGVGRKSVVRSPKRAAGATAPASKSRK
jgi:hypothetical protein